MKPNTETIVKELRELFHCAMPARTGTVISAAADRLEELEKVVEKLPKTKDGVPYTGFANSDGGRYGDTMLWMIDYEDLMHSPYEEAPYDNSEVMKSFTTREAALAAQEANQ